MKAKAGLLSPTFAEGPSSFLSSLDSRPVPRASGNASVDVSRVRSELIMQIEALTSQHESALADLEASLAQIQQHLRPNLQHCENQQNSTQRELEEARAKVQQIGAADLAPLQSQYDQLGIRFERFMRVDVEAKLRPLQESLRTSKSRLDELLGSTNASFKRLNEQVKEMTNRVNDSADALSREQSKFAAEIGSLKPRITEMEQQIDQVRDALDDAPAVSGSAGVEKQIAKAEATILRLNQEVLPAQIEQANQPFVDAVKQLGQYCEKQVAKMQKSFDELQKSHEEIITMRNGTEEALDTLTTASFDIQSKFTRLDEDVRTRMANLSQKAESTVDALKAKIADVAEEQETGRTTLNGQVSNDAARLKARVHMTVKKLKDALRKIAGGDQKEQQESMILLERVKDELEGEGNLMARVKAVEDQVDYCVETMCRIHDERTRLACKGITTERILDRIAYVEKRLAEAEARLGKMDNKEAVEAVQSMETVERIAQLPPQAEESTDDVVIRSKEKFDLEPEPDTEIDLTRTVRQTYEWEREIDSEDDTDDVQDNEEMQPVETDDAIVIDANIPFEPEEDKYEPPHHEEEKQELPEIGSVVPQPKEEEEYDYSYGGDADEPNPYQALESVEEQPLPNESHPIEPEQERKPEPEQEPEPVLEQEQKPEPEQEIEQEPVVEQEPEQKQEPEPEPSPEPEPEQKPEPQVQVPQKKVQKNEVKPKAAIQNKRLPPRKVEPVVPKSRLPTKPSISEAKKTEVAKPVRPKQTITRPLRKLPVKK